MSVETSAESGGGRPAKSVFDPEWLAQREPADTAARDAGGIARFAAERASRLAAAPLEIVDLGTGTGANVRYLAPWLGPDQRWRALDVDETVLERARADTAGWTWARGAEGGAIAFAGARPDAPRPVFGGKVRFERAALNDDPARLAPDGVGLVTASALLDLAGATWLRALVERVAAIGAAALFAQSYDGRVSWLPAHPDDVWMHRRFDDDQRTDKGLGAALGPGAAERACRLFGTAGYEVETVRADWRLGNDWSALQRAMVGGWAGAVAAVSPGESERVARWRRERLARIDAGDAELRVGHTDLFAAPRGRASPRA